MVFEGVSVSGMQLKERLVGLNHSSMFPMHLYEWPACTCTCTCRPLSAMKDKTYFGRVCYPAMYKLEVFNVMCF